MKRSQSLDGRGQIDPSMFLTLGHRTFLSELPKEKNMIMLISHNRDIRLNDARLPIHLLFRWFSRSSQAVVQ